jgi:hypothetical protein
MGEAFDSSGNVLGSASGATKAEVFEALNKAHGDAAEIRIRSMEQTMAAQGEGPRLVTTHHDGHGLNESIVIEANPLGPGNASHRYALYISEPDKDNQIVGTIQFQEGPRNVAGSKPGMTEAALLAVLIDRLQGFQAGPYACRENAIQLTKLEEVLHWTKARADARAKRGVLGTYNK